MGSMVTLLRSVAVPISICIFRAQEICYGVLCFCREFLQ